MKETFGQRLARLRKAKGYTQEDIANKINISPQAVSKWENDLSTPDIFILSQLADILEVSVDELLGREEDTNESPKEETQEDEKETVDSEVVDDDEKKKEEYVHVGPDGIHVHDGDDHIDIDVTGIHVYDGKDGIDIGEKHHRCTKTSITRKVGHSILWGLAIVAYVLIGVFWKDQNMGWRMGWIIFLMLISFESILYAVRKRRFTHFAYPVFITGIYCLLGFLGAYLGFEGWTVYWFLFITIPAYYLIFGWVDNIIHRKVVIIHGNQDDDDDD